MMNFRFVPASDTSLLVVVGDEISWPTSARVVALFRALRGARAPFVVDLHPAYTSVLIELDPRATHGRAERLVERLAQRIDDVAESAPARTVDVAVRYGGADGPDLEDLARIAGLSPAEVIERHASAHYVVAFLGFLPGFAYLLGLDPSLAAPRLETPRPRVPRGSVAVAGGQTAIYPRESPGGWRLIGRTDRELAPGWVEPGDAVRFVPVGGR